MELPLHGGGRRRGVVGAEAASGVGADAGGDPLALLLAESPAVVWRRELLPPHPFLFLSANVERVLGYPPEALRLPEDALRRLVLEEDRAVLDQALIAAGAAPARVVYRLLDGRGAIRWIQEEVRRVHDPSGRPSHLQGHLIDVTDRQAVVEELVRTEERNALAVQGSQAGLWDLDVASNRAYLSPRVVELLGYAEDELDSHVDLSLLLSHIHADDRVRFEAALLAHLEGLAAFSLEVRLCPQRGANRWVQVCGQASWVGDLRPARVAGWVTDISQRHHLEEELRQAQKMEAVGRLAGGVAHDFNNLLSVILGCAQLLSLELAADHPGAEDAREITAAARRAAALTRQLLAFSRQQPMQPQVVCLGESLGGLEKMLRRLIDENVELQIVPPLRPCSVLIDPGHLEQVIVNLVVNARDAIGEAGTISASVEQVEALPLDATVGAAQVAPGPYAVLRVSDSGHGMDAGTRARIFEPFFTTKEKGKGTGLGLATVYGIIAQNGGRIAVDSEPGRGTTFRLYLPRSAEPSDRREAAIAAAHPQRGARRATVLLAEDDDHLRALVRRLLEGAGIQVIAARDGREAVQLAERSPVEIDLLVTDVVMPGLSGVQVYQALRSSLPALPALFMSGYADSRNLPPDGAPFLAKPFSPDALQSRVVELLDARLAARVQRSAS